MHFRSITTKLLLLILGTYVLSLFCILIIADRQLYKIIDKSQTEIYKEKLDFIWSEVERTEQRLQQTGLVNAYIDDFKESLLDNLSRTYHNEKDPLIYPFIIDRDFNTVLHPTIPPGNDYFTKYNLKDRMEYPEQGQFTLRIDSDNSWYIYQEFAPWNWILCYKVPVSEKYKDARSFISMLMIVMLMFIFIILPVLITILVNFIKPVIMLTEVSQKMAEGELNHQMSITSQDEIGKLAQSFEFMQSSIKQKIEDLHIEITERKKIEKELQKARDYIGSVIESMPSVLIGVDPKGIVTQWNSKAAEMTEIPPGSAIGRTLDEVLPFSDISLFSIQSAIQKGIVQYYPQQIRREEDMVNYNDITIYPLKSLNEKGAVIRIDDVTDKTVLEEQLVQAQKMDAIGHLAGGIAHDFNNMLAGITGAASLLRTIIKPDDQRSLKYLNLIQDASNKAADLTSRLLSFGRKSNMPATALNIHDIVNSALALLERTLDRKIVIQTDAAAEKPILSGDYSAVQNALMNLAINSSHAMRNGGTLYVGTKNIYLDREYCSSSPFELQPGDYIDLEVSDTGTGIPVDCLGKIFEPFYTTKEQGEGTGLGLSSVYGTIQNHNGAVLVDSTVGQGTVFHLYFPCSEQEVSSSQDKGGILKKGSGTILLIDDEEIIRLTVKPILSKMGYTVLLAEDGVEGLEVFKMERKNISIVISDMIMPRMNGRELFYEIRKISPSCPFIISSGFTMDENLGRMREDGLNGFIQKPFLADELAKLLDRILH